MLLNFARRILGHSSLLQLMERKSCNMQQYGDWYCEIFVVM